METSRKNKKTNCAPKPRPNRNHSNVNSNPGCRRNENTTNASGNLTSAESNTNKQLQETPCINNTKQINYKIQNYAKAVSEEPEKICKETNQDLVYVSANTQFFQTKVTYYPGKNLNDLKQVLRTETIEKSRFNGCTIRKVSSKTEKGRKFGKHLTCPKKKSRKMRIAQKPLNTIEEVNENDRSKESLKKEMQKTDTQQNIPSSITLSHSDVNEHKEIAKKENNSRNNELNIKIPEQVYGQKECVSYSFHNAKSVLNPIENSSSRPRKITLPILDIQSDKKHVLQIRDMFEKLSKNDLISEKPDLKPAIRFHPIHFDHSISCEECQRILKDLINIDNLPKKGVTEMPYNSARKILDSMVQDICERTTNKSDVSFRIETQNHNTVSKISYRRSRRRYGKRKDIEDMQYKNFFLLALAISLVLYCFYCRLNEKKR